MTTIKQLQDMSIRELNYYKNSLNPEDSEFTIYVINQVIKLKIKNEVKDDKRIIK